MKMDYDSSFNKKDKEKQKAKNKQEKAQRKEERKAHSSKGKGLEDMMAYVDEYGNLSDTPPDPNKKIEINVDDIVIGAAKQEPVAPEDKLRTGVITFFNTAKGFGFISDAKSRASVFVHINQMLEPLKENDKVTFETETGPKGLNAVRVKKLK